MHVNAGAARPTAVREPQLRDHFPEAVSESQFDASRNVSFEEDNFEVFKLH